MTKFWLRFWFFILQLVSFAASFKFRNDGTLTTKISLFSRGGSDQHHPNKQPLQFYIFQGGLCPFAGRTWIVLLELQTYLEFEMNFIDFSSPKPDSFLKINPRGRVPALYNPNDGTTVHESAICNEYLYDLVSSTAAGDYENSTTITIMPVLASERAKLRLLNDQFDNDIFPRVRSYIMADENNDQQRQQCLHALEELQESLGEGPYFMGDTFTIADAHVIPFIMRWIVQLKELKDFEVNTPSLMKLMRWYKLCQTRPSVQAATIPDDKIMEVHYMKVKFLKSQVKKKQHE